MYITLKTLKLTTAQEVFDQVAKHLLTQRKKNESLDRELGIKTCRYRGDNGLKCAAGCLIADDEYHPSMEGLSWDVLVGQFKLSDRYSRLISELQMIHDSFDPKNWLIILKKLAEKWDLNNKILLK